MLTLRHLFNRFNRCWWRQTIAGVLLLTAAIFWLAPQLVLAQLSTGLEVAGSTGLAAGDPKTFIVNIIRVVLGFVGLVAVGIVLFGGFKWMASRGVDEKIKLAKKTILNGIIGLVIILAAWLIVEFVIRQFSQVIFGPGTEESERPPEFNYGALGGGVLRDVYPAPGARDVPRNTLIMTSFKEPIALASIIFKPETKPAQCSQELYDREACGYLAQSGRDQNLQPHIQIINLTQSATTSLAFDRVVIFTTDGKNFVIRPLEPLGSPNGFNNYKVVLTGNIRRASNNGAAFSGTGYGWVFTVSNILDITPPRLLSVIPSANANGVVKNSLIQLNFSEPLNAVTASGRVILGDLAQGIGNQQQFEAESNPYRLIYISYQDANGARAYVAGDFTITNGFRTIEFIPRARCTNANNQPVQNSCGRDVFCLPGPIQLGVVAVAASVNAVTHETIDVFSGLTDAAGNSLDGNGNGQAQGPQADNYQWQFSTSNDLDLDPPQIVVPLTPAYNQTAVPVNTPVRAQFNKPMSSATLISDYFGILKNGLVNNRSCTSSVSRLDPNDPTPNATVPFPGSNLADCYPVGFTVVKEEVYLRGLNATGTLASLRLNGNLADNTPYLNRLSDKIQDLHQNCFNPAVCAPNQPNCPDQSGHN